MLPLGSFSARMCQFTSAITSTRRLHLNKTAAFSHLLRLLLVLVLVIIIIIVIFLFILLFVLRFLCIVLLFLLLLLNLRQCFPFSRKIVSLSFIIRDDDIVKDRATFHLPQIKTDEAKVLILVNVI